MPVVCLDPVALLPTLSFQGRVIFKKTYIERFCKKCGKKFFKDTRDLYFQNLDKYGIKTKDSKMVLPYCIDCYLDFIISNRSITEYF